MDIIVLVFSYVLIIAGIVGTIMPMIPGLVLILAGILLYVWYVGFSVLGINFLLAIILLTIVGTFIDIIASAIGAKKYGASNTAMIAFIFGLILGFMTMGPLGLIIGPIIAVILTEIFKGRSLSESLKVTLGVLIGSLSGIVIRFFIGITMAIMFTIKVFLINFSI